MLKSCYRTTNTLISIFSALPQTLKPDLEIVNVILNIPIINDGEQHKDNNNSVSQYIESNNDKILHLAEKELRRPGRSIDK